MQFSLSENSGRHKFEASASVTVKRSGVSLFGGVRGLKTAVGCISHHVSLDMWADKLFLRCSEARTLPPTFLRDAAVINVLKGFN